MCFFPVVPPFLRGRYHVVGFGANDENTIHLFVGGNIVFALVRDRVNEFVRGEAKRINESVSRQSSVRC